jgi:uncharacterized protein YoaH (UPF0181 family)
LARFRDHPENQCCGVSFFDFPKQFIVNDAECITHKVTPDILEYNRRYTLQMTRYTMEDLTCEARCTIREAIANLLAQGAIESVAVTHVAEFYHVNHSTAWFIWNVRYTLKDLTTEDKCSICREIADLQAQGVSETAAVSQVAKVHYMYHSTAWSIWKTRNTTPPANASQKWVREKGLPLPLPATSDPNVASTRVNHSSPPGNPNPHISAPGKARPKKQVPPPLRQFRESPCVELIRQSSQIDLYYHSHVFLPEQRGYGPYGSDLEVCYPDWSSSSDDDSDNENDPDV